MQCPYCKEAINDQAVVCHHCRHNVSVLREKIHERREIAELKTKLSEHRAYAAVADLSTIHRAELLAASLVAGQTKPRRILVAAFMPALLLATALAAYTSLEKSIGLEIERNSLVMHYVSTPLQWTGVEFMITILAGIWIVGGVPFGIWAGLHWGGRGHKVGYPFVSLLVGVFTLVCITLGNLILVGRPFKLPGGPASGDLQGEMWSIGVVVAAFLLAVVVPLLQFWSGLLFSDLVKSWATKSPQHREAFGEQTVRQIMKALIPFFVSLGTIAGTFNQLLTLGGYL